MPRSKADTVVEDLFSRRPEQQGQDRSREIPEHLRALYMGSGQVNTCQYLWWANDLGFQGEHKPWKTLNFMASKVIPHDLDLSPSVNP